jgi:hypothetical protein
VSPLESSVPRRAKKTGPVHAENSAIRKVFRSIAASISIAIALLFVGSASAEADTPTNPGLDTWHQTSSATTSNGGAAFIQQQDINDPLFLETWVKSVRGGSLYVQVHSNGLSVGMTHANVTGVVAACKMDTPYNIARNRALLCEQRHYSP